MNAKSHGSGSGLGLARFRFDSGLNFSMGFDIRFEVHIGSHSIMLKVDVKKLTQDDSGSNFSMGFDVRFEVHIGSHSIKLKVDVKKVTQDVFVPMMSRYKGH